MNALILQIDLTKSLRDLAERCGEWDSAQTLTDELENLEYQLEAMLGAHYVS